MGTPSERRRAILQAASRLFEHYGHGKTTIADVAREARVGVGTVYLEFESKDAIVSELSLSTHVGVLEAMREASLRTLEPAERLTAVLLARTECFLELGKKGQHACELIHCKTDAVRSAHERFCEEEQTLLATILGQGQQRGRFNLAHVTGDERRAAALVQRAFASLSPPSIFTTSEQEARRSAEGMSQLLLHGLASSWPVRKSETQPGAERSPGVAKRAKPLRTRKPSRPR